MRPSESARAHAAQRAVQPGIAVTNITDEHRWVLEVLTGGSPGRFFLFSCVCDSNPAARSGAWLDRIHIGRLTDGAGVQRAAPVVA